MKIHAVIVFQKIFPPILLHMIHYIFAFFSHNLGPNSQSGDKHTDIELAILELNTKFYYKCTIIFTTVNIIERYDRLFVHLNTCKINHNTLIILNPTLVFLQLPNHNMKVYLYQTPFKIFCLLSASKPKCNFGHLPKFSSAINLVLILLISTIVNDTPLS